MKSSSAIAILFSTLAYGILGAIIGGIVDMLSSGPGADNLVRGAIGGMALGAIIMPAALIFCAIAARGTEHLGDG